MNVGMAGCFGLFFGAIVGGIIGIGLGFAWISFFHTTSFEGYSGMLVFYSLMPVGTIVGALVGAFGLGMVAARDRVNRRCRGLAGDLKRGFARDIGLAHGAVVAQRHQHE